MFQGYSPPPCCGAMQPPAQTFPVLSFLGVIVELGGALMLVGLFLMLRQFVPRRAYFRAWTAAWGVVAVAVFVLAIRYVLAPQLDSATVADAHPAVRGLYFVYQLCKALGYVFFLRGTLMYVSGSAIGQGATRRIWAVAVLFAVVSTLASRHGFNEMVVWQSAIAVPALGYCASALFWLPRSRRTPGSVATGVCFGVLALLWLVYAGAFSLAMEPPSIPLPVVAGKIIALHAYFDLAVDVLLGYAMVLVLMEDGRREANDAQAELRVTHDQLRRAALYDSLTDSLNRRAFAEGVGLDMVRATFGTVVLADLDNLKLVNDHYGHPAGDQVLRRCADVLRNTLRSYDKLYRWGGDEFLLIVTSAHAADVLERLRRVLDEADAVDVGTGDARVPLEVSLGAADFASSEELSFSIEHADREMYAEKARRKGEARGTLSGMPSPTSVSTAS